MNKDQLLEMLSYKRPGNSEEVENWSKNFIVSKIDKSKNILFIDEYKNRFYTKLTSLQNLEKGSMRIFPSTKASFFPR